MGIDPVKEDAMYRELDGPNSRQVGGDHYHCELQHWDFVEDWGLGYLECVATKYLCRWRDKDGLRDLEKAIHYVDKLIDRCNNNGRKPKACVSISALVDFAAVQELGTCEDTAMVFLCRWSDVGDLKSARGAIKRLMDKETPMLVPNPTGMETPFGFEEDDDVA